MKVNQISSNESFLKLKKIKNSRLIDVRTSFEWNSTGIPDLSSINKDVFLIEWEQYIDLNFERKFQNILLNNFDKKCHLFFVCKSGIRSNMAAKLALILGYINCYNILDGYDNYNKTNWKNILPTKKFID